ncbi:MAG: DUF3375 domain-containing protein, partial [Acidobacteria bacterium]|nr:DUF3375 domain-containing protein [Acidobacteriota bacterium]
MRLEKLLTYFETSPALRLLRSPNAPFIVDFLTREFKQAGRIAIPHSDLQAALLDYQEELRGAYPDKLPSPADVYLAEWCSHDALWLRRFLEAGRAEAVYQLTPHTEDVLVFMDRALDKDLGFVGTESRLKLVIDTLTDVVVGSSDNPESRLLHLREAQRRIMEDIERIEAEGSVTKYQPAQIRERFSTAVSLLRQLQSDFRAVEESFRKITLQVQQRESEGQDARGSILQFALDSEDVLKQEDQGVSFYEFVKLILSPSQTERLERVIQEIRRIPELTNLPEGLETVRGMITLLQIEADKVMRTNQRLSATLRRLLDARARAERQQVARLLRQIRGLAVAMADSPPFDEIGLELRLETEIDSPFRRTLWSEIPQFESVDLRNYEADEEARRAAFQRFAAMRRLDWKEMRTRIQHLVRLKGAVTLGELLNAHPPKAGVVEVLGYLQLACDEQHLVNPSASEDILLPPIREQDRPVLVTVPLVTFRTQ